MKYKGVTQCQHQGKGFSVCSTCHTHSP